LILQKSVEKVQDCYEMDKKNKKFFIPTASSQLQYLFLFEALWVSNSSQNCISCVTHRTFPAT